MSNIVRRKAFARSGQLPAPLHPHPSPALAVAHGAVLGPAHEPADTV